MPRFTLLLSPFVAYLLAITGCAAPTDSASASDQSAFTEDARVQFSTDGWEPRWSGTPHAGARLIVDYELGRLPQCRNQSRLVSWVVEVSWRFDGGEVHTAALSGSPGTGTTLPDSAIAIPPGARSIELWFENRAVGGYDHCSAWDSQYGANYRHDIQ